jgi:hypothetical protein
VVWAVRHSSIGDAFFDRDAVRGAAVRSAGRFADSLHLSQATFLQGVLAARAPGTPPDAPRTAPLGCTCRARPRVLLHAVRKGAPPASDGGMDAAAVASWTSFAEAVVPDGRDPRSADGLTPEFRAAVNLMCNRRLAYSGDMAQLDAGERSTGRRS